MSDFTGQRFKPRTSRIRDERVTAQPAKELIYRFVTASNKKQSFIRTFKLRINQLIDESVQKSIIFSETGQTGGIGVARGGAQGARAPPT